MSATCTPSCRADDFAPYLGPCQAVILTLPPTLDQVGPGFLAGQASGGRESAHRSRHERDRGL